MDENKQLLRQTFVAGATWLLIVVLTAGIMALKPPVLGLFIAWVFVGVAAKLQDEVIFA